MAAISPQVLGILTGGVGSAILLGIFAALAKASGQQGLTGLPFLIIVGATVLVVGLLGTLVTSYLGAPPEGASMLLGSGTRQAAWLGIAAGITWSLAMLLFKVALDHYGTPVSILTPILNTNTLIAVLLGLWIFAEWQAVKLSPLLVGAALIVVGGVLVSGATQGR